MSTSHFDEAAANWDAEPRRIAVMKAIGEKILAEASPPRDVKVLDYGCGTGLVSLYLLPHVDHITGADSSTGMLDVLRGKIAEGGIRNMEALPLNLECDAVPTARFGMIVVTMALHHIANLERVLDALYEMLDPGGILCVADLDTEPGTFHPADVSGSVHHHGFDREQLKSRLAEIGFSDLKDTTATTIRKPVEGGGEEDFSVFLITARR